MKRYKVLFIVMTLIKLSIVFIAVISFTLSLPSQLYAETLSIRALHIPLTDVDHIAYLKTTIDRISGKFNMLIIQLNDKVRYDTFCQGPHNELKDLNSNICNNNEYISKGDLKEIVHYAKSKGLEVVPEVKYLTHQEKLLGKRYPSLMFNEVTYDPTNPKVYQIVFSVIDELIDVFQPKYFHIGHDEMREHVHQKPGGYSKIPSYSEYARDANTIANYLKEKGVIPMMWGDMLLNPNHFEAKKKNDLNGDIQDYYKAISLLDKAIVIVDWHYWWKEDVFPTVDYFLSKGFKVLGATWKDEKTTRNFSAYIKQLKNPNVLGMVATTWFYFVRREDDIIDRIISISAQEFNK